MSRPSSRQAPRLELFTIGDELLLGQTVDSNAAWLAKELAAAGIRVVRHATVGDDAAAIRDALGEALRRTGAVICTGGLGPTRDDLTRPAAAALFGRPLHVQTDLLQQLRGRFLALGREMSPSNRSQAEVPEGALVLPNAHGTAPGLVLTGRDGEFGQRDAFAVLLPGVPREMRGIFTDELLPWLLQRWPERAGAVRHRVIRTTGIAESEVADRVEGALEGEDRIDVAFLPSTTGVDLRLTSRGDLSEDACDAVFEEVELALRPLLGAHAYGIDGEDLVDAVAARLQDGGHRLALAESCTGGLVAKRLTDRPGSSAYLLGGVVAYANEAKVELLGVGADLLATHGAVSEPVASAMARGAARRLGADCAIAVTGIAGPGGGTEAKPVGTVCVAAIARERERLRTFRFAGDREEVRERSAQAALAMLWELIGEQIE